ncbi:hypothetical protein [Sphingomonas colocasiae]|uniref:DUF3471 domain-containing protein n=1 Tax=Sphingomonas colocasiae TaxID=1848973 RepID=A0ABS7PX84_9SPHN|nr:hypothetical protein [Sphingomonas colocasiae]MBY8825968.1 hypothetical protein [Sphingomonas colocasiae]
MTKFVTAAVAALAIALPAAALAQPEQARFEHEGFTYVFTARDSGKAKIIAGKRYPGADSFRLIVSNGRVRGTSAGKSVEFRLNDVERIDQGATLASR